MSPTSLCAAMVLLLCALLDSPADARRRGPCESVGSRTIAAGPLARVFVKRRNGRIYVCSRVSGRRVFVGPRSLPELDTEGLGPFAVAGGLVAYGRDRGSFRSGSHPVIIVRDAASGQVVRFLGAGAWRGSAFSEPVAGDGLRGLTVTTGGDAAWIVRNPFAVAPPEPNVSTTSRSTEVYVAPRGLPPTLVDQSDEIAPRSLAREGCAISWLHGTERRSARICP